ncbi:hypothetical protein BKA70DRAFT_1232222 [Coprinopsis sp. MPI-PUGE-AT-0042]|nr:hypothetical protein BKA70DRAFT_1232222 [Coprinopsis sp. MPI-PUGE-AT-0042]
MPSPPVLLRWNSETLRSLSAEGWQALLNYLSSRIRAASQTFIQRYESITKPERIDWVRAISHEVRTAIILLSMGSMRYPNAILAPACLRSVFLAVWTNNVDITELDIASVGGHSMRDGVLNYYSDAWWTEGRPEAIDSMRLVRAWVDQRSLIVRRLPEPPIVNLQLDFLTLEGLQDARSYTSQALKIVEEGLTSNFQASESIAASMEKYEKELQRGATSTRGPGDKRKEYKGIQDTS